ncbi:MAG: phosphate transport system regulatory protein PhoU, partial [Alphaproteobacteria bacterium]|nr:phosphate transport system regulatory protein PhoU [Alphaproteobacteria bacterium]
MNDHTVKSYDKELEFLGLRIVEMGGICEKMLADAMEALTLNNSNLAAQTVARDPRLDQLHRAVEEHAVTTIARRQPMAVDLRELMGAVRIAGDLERVGDLAKNIAKRTLKIAAEPRIPRATIGLRHMVELAAQ